MDQPKAIAKSALQFLSGTLFSRITGLARDMSMAFFFGATPAIAAFLVAFRFANLLRRIFGEGALLNSFIPHFESHRKGDPKRAAYFFRDTFGSLFIILIILIFFIECALYGISFIFNPANQQIAHLIQVIFPGVIFICLFSLCSGLLQCEKHFFATGVSPVAFNIIWILSIWIFRKAKPDMAALGLSFGVTIAFLCQWLAVMPKTMAFLKRHLSWKEIVQCKLFSKDIRNMLTALTLGVIGVVAVQINTAIDTIFARMACLEGPAFLNYAIHLHQLPLVLGIAISAAFFPPLSRAANVDYPRLLESSLSMALFVIIPCAMAIFVLGLSSVNLLFGHGAFDAHAIGQTTLCLWGYGVGLIPMVITLLLAPAFYAKKNYRIPVIASLISIFLNFILNFLTVSVFHLGPSCIAITTSLAALCNACILWHKMELKVSDVFKTFVLKTALCAMVAGGIGLSIGYMLGDCSLPLLLGQKTEFASGFLAQMSVFAQTFCAFVVPFCAMTWVFNRTYIAKLFPTV